jgi:hypothetical protein
LWHWAESCIVDLTQLLFICYLKWAALDSSQNAGLLSRLLSKLFFHGDHNFMRYGREHATPVTLLSPLSISKPNKRDYYTSLRIKTFQSCYFICSINKIRILGLYHIFRANFHCYNSSWIILNRYWRIPNKYMKHNNNFISRINFEFNVKI